MFFTGGILASTLSTGHARLPEPHGSEGRSTATTILSLSTILGLKDVEGIAERGRKLLSFTDNRQDASLQAGHFNDFVEVGLLRAAIYAAVAASGPEGLEHDALGDKVVSAIDLP